MGDKKQQWKNKYWLPKQGWFSKLIPLKEQRSAPFPPPGDGTRLTMLFSALLNICSEKGKLG